MADDPTEQALSKLSTPHLADACLRVGVSVRCGPASLRPLVRGMRCEAREPRLLDFESHKVSDARFIKPAAIICHKNVSRTGTLHCLEEDIDASKVTRWGACTEIPTSWSTSRYLYLVSEGCQRALGG